MEEERELIMPGTEAPGQQRLACGASRQRWASVVLASFALVGLLGAPWSRRGATLGSVRPDLLQLDAQEQGPRVVVLARFLVNHAFNAPYVERSDPRHRVNGRETYWSEIDYFLYWCPHDGQHRWLLSWQSSFDRIREGKECDYAAAGPQNVETLGAKASVGWAEYVADSKEMVSRPTSGVDLVYVQGKVKDGNFSASEHWPTCFRRMLGSHLRTQESKCNNGWASTVARVMEWRLCIKQPEQFKGDAAFISTGYITSCSKDAYSRGPGGSGCDRGNPLLAMRWAAEHGVPTGGPAGSSHTCVPNFLPGPGLQQGKPWVPPCPLTCGSVVYGRTLPEDLFRPEGWASSWTTTSAESAMKAIRQTGPIVIGFKANSHFSGNYSPGTVYRYTPDDTSFTHVAVADGFGPDYFAAGNSWGLLWGDGGRFKIHKDSVDSFVIPGPMKGVGEGYPYPLPSYGKQEWVDFTGFRQKWLNGKYAQVRGGRFLVSGKQALMKTTGDYVMYWCPLVNCWAIARLDYIEALRSGKFCRYWALSSPNADFTAVQDWLEFDRESLKGEATEGSPVSDSSEETMHFLQ